MGRAETAGLARSLRPQPDPHGLDIGELVVGAWLTQVKNFDFVVYNQRPGRDLAESFAPKGLAGVSARLAELNIIGFHTPLRESYLAECTTHFDCLLYGAGVAESVLKLRQKFAVSAAYATVTEGRTGLQANLAFWSPKVSKQVLQRTGEIEGAAGVNGRVEVPTHGHEKSPPRDVLSGHR